jgi:drug/metabolite transporter (DMT)-like permease
MECVLIECMSLSGLDKGRLKAVVALLLLCLLWSLGSLRGDLIPQMGLDQGLRSGFLRQAIPFAMLAIAAALFAAARRAVWPRGREFVACALIGLCLFVAPTGMVYLARIWISDLTRVALFSIAPVFAVIFEPYIGTGLEVRIKGGLAAALVAVVGTLFVFPLELPQSVAAAIAFCGVLLAAACVAAANCWAVRVANQLHTSLAPLAAIAGAAAAVGFIAFGATLRDAAFGGRAIGPEMAWSAAVELPALMLLFWLMRRMSATQMTTRFLLAPLLANLIGLIFLRPAVSLREGLGLLLIALGAGWLLFGREGEPDAVGSPLHLNAD